MVRINMPRTSKDQRTARLLDVCWNEEDRLMGRIYLDMTVVTLPMEASAGKAVSGIIEYSACTALIGLNPLHPCISKEDRSY